MEEKLVEVENMRWEYREVASGHRFYVGLRFIIAAFTATLQSALLKFYNDLMQTRPPEPPSIVLIFGFHVSLEAQPISIAAVGFLTMVAILIMEIRNMDRFGIMVYRGKELEDKLLLANGQFGQLSQGQGWWFVNYRTSLMVIYSVIGLMWAYLLSLNIIALFQRS